MHPILWGLKKKIIECQYNFAVNKNLITTEQCSRIDVFTFRHLCVYDIDFIVFYCN